MATVADSGALLTGRIDTSLVGYGSTGATAQYSALTDAASIATNASLAKAFSVTLAGNRTLANPTNLQAGTWVFWRVKQDATGSRTLAYGSFFKWPGGIAPSVSTTAAAVDHIAGFVHDTSTIECTIVRDVR